VVDAMLEAVQTGETNEMKLDGLRALANLGAGAENKSRLFGTKGVVEAMLSAAQYGETIEIKQEGLRGLGNISINISVAERLVDEHDILSLLKSI
jgi:hypothetical protein